MNGLKHETKHQIFSGYDAADAYVYQHDHMEEQMYWICSPVSICSNQ